MLEFQQQFAAGQVSIGVQLTEFLENWLVKHVLGVTRDTSTSSPSAAQGSEELLSREALREGAVCYLILFPESRTPLRLRGSG